VKTQNVQQVFEKQMGKTGVNASTIIDDEGLMSGKGVFFRLNIVFRKL